MLVKHFLLDTLVPFNLQALTPKYLKLWKTVTNLNMEQSNQSITSNRIKPTENLGSPNG